MENLKSSVYFTKNRHSFAGFALTFNLVSAIRHKCVPRDIDRQQKNHIVTEVVMAKERGRVGGVTDLSRCDSSESFHG